MAGVTIKLFLPKGDAQSLRTAELVNWTGKALAGPRSQLDDLLAREELAKSGVYVLLGVDPDTGKQAVPEGDKLRFTHDTEFSSPSMAGAVICGGHVNGLTFWRDKDGRNLKEIEGAD
ncbi:MAG: DUF4357 domain-containing protein [Verrucomicrobiia bacterium]|jgi:hypothetical protein